MAAQEFEIESGVECNRRFRWDNGDKVSNLIRCLGNYKSQMEFDNKDFNADKVKQYESIRASLAKIYESDPLLFGPPCIVSNPKLSKSDNSLNENERKEKSRLQKQQKEDKELIKRGYQRVQEKVKEIRQNFSIAVTSGRRSGSGKVVLEFYDELVQIWGGSPSTKPLSCGKCTEEVNCSSSGDQEQSDLPSDDSPVSSHHDADNSPVTPNSMGDSAAVCRKRKYANTVPKLIDSKRKHMKRS